MKFTDEETRLTEEAIKQAEEYIEKYDYHLANFVLRNCPVVAKTELTELSWAMHNDGNVSKNDVLGLIEHIKREMKGV